jgi:signal transduction histidine kinase
VEAPQLALERELDRLHVEVANLRAARKRLAMAEDAERRAIERDLHQGVQQHLVALATHLQVAAGLVERDPAAARALLDELGRVVQLAIDDAAALADWIYLPLIETGGLAVALRSAALRADVPTQIEVDMRTPPPPAVVRTAYLCCLEVLKHASAGAQAAVSVRDQDGALAFDAVADCAESDLEIGRLRDRVEALGGTLSMTSQAGRRTRVAGSIPLG